MTDDPFDPEFLDSIIPEWKKRKGRAVTAHRLEHPPAVVRFTCPRCTAEHDRRPKVVAEVVRSAGELLFVGREAPGWGAGDAAGAMKAHFGTRAPARVALRFALIAPGDTTPTTGWCDRHGLLEIDAERIAAALERVAAEGRRVSITAN